MPRFGGAPRGMKMELRAMDAMDGVDMVDAEGSVGGSPEFSRQINADFRGFLKTDNSTPHRSRSLPAYRSESGLICSANTENRSILGRSFDRKELKKRKDKRTRSLNAPRILVCLRLCVLCALCGSINLVAAPPRWVNLRFKVPTSSMGRGRHRQIVPIPHDNRRTHEHEEPDAHQHMRPRARPLPFMERNPP